MYTCTVTLTIVNIHTQWVDVGIFHCLPHIFCAALCYLIAVIIYGAEKSPTGSVSYSSFYSLGYYLGYSYGLAIVAFILEAVTGVLLLLDGKALSVTTSPA